MSYDALAPDVLAGLVAAGWVLRVDNELRPIGLVLTTPKGNYAIVQTCVPWHDTPGKWWAYTQRADRPLYVCAYCVPYGTAFQLHETFLQVRGFKSMVAAAYEIERHNAQHRGNLCK